MRCISTFYRSAQRRRQACSIPPEWMLNLSGRAAQSRAEYSRRELKVHISHLCYILCTAAEDYYKNNKKKFDFIKYSIEDDRPKTFL